MSLRSRIVLILVGIVLSWALVDNGTLRLFAGRVFGTWEREEASEDLARIERRIAAELGELEGRARVYSGLSDVERFVAGEEPGFAEENLGREVLDLAGVDLFYLCDPTGRVAWGLVLDPETREPMRLTEFPREALARNHVALHFRAPAEQVAGILMTRSHPLLFSSVPIRGRDGQAFAVAGGDPRVLRHGTVVLGRFLAKDLERAIVAEELENSSDEGGGALARVQVLEPEDADVPEEVRKGTRRELFLPGQDGLLHAYATIDALRTGAPLILHVALTRVIAERGRASVDYALLSTLASSLLILFVLLRLLRSVVIEPLSALTSKAVEIGRRDDTTIRVGMQRKDEIGQLAGEFDRMLEKLAHSREQVIETARLAGMSEIATGVLHNVGNVLNSVNVAANLASTRAQELSLGDLEMLVRVLEQHQADLAAFVDRDPRGKHLVPFLSELSRALGTQKTSLQDELRSLNQGIEHIAELVRAQQSYAGQKGVLERTALEEQVEAALAISGQILGSTADVEVQRDYAKIPAVKVDRHKLMEILVNVLQNARQSLAERGGDGKRIALCISRPDPHTARIEVTDNGVGIPAENLTRIFHHGFTTKKSGHGFGLHASANAATEMGAKLQARSDGPGRGATFWIDIPMEEEPALAA